MSVLLAAALAAFVLIAAALAFAAFVHGNPRRFLSESDRLTLEAVDALPIMIWATRRSQGGEEIIALSSGGGLKHYGTTPGELVGRDLATLATDGKASPALAAIRRVIDTGEPELLVAPRPTRSGLPRHYITYIGRSPTGQIVGADCATMDVTGLVEAKLGAEREVERLTRANERAIRRAQAAEDEAEALRLRNIARASYEALAAAQARTTDPDPAAP